jgi:hypothetical protein
MGSESEWPDDKAFVNQDGEAPRAINRMQWDYVFVGGVVESFGRRAELSGHRTALRDVEVSRGERSKPEE